METQNKFTAIGTTVHGRHLFITSEKASLELMGEVMRITHQDATYSIFNGHVTSAYDAHVSQPLMEQVKKTLAWLRDLDSEDIVIPSIRDRIEKLNEYVSVIEAPLKETSNSELNDIRIEHIPSKTSDLELGGGLTSGMTTLSIGGIGFKMPTVKWTKVKFWISKQHQEEAVKWWAKYWGHEYSHAVKTIDRIKVAIELGVIS